jgi:hypothetical protein
MTFADPTDTSLTDARQGESDLPEAFGGGNLFKFICGWAFIAIIMGLAINIFFDGNIGDPKLWYYATVAICLVDYCIIGLGAYRDRAQEAKRKRYIEKIETLYRAGLKRSTKHG